MREKQTTEILYFDAKVELVGSGFVLNGKHLFLHLTEIEELIYGDPDSCATKRDLGTVNLFLEDIKIDNDKGVAVLLFTKSSSSRRTPGAKNILTNENKNWELNDKEEPCTSLHCLFDFGSVKETQASYLFLIEHIEGFGASTVFQLINHLLNKCSRKFSDKYTIPHPETGLMGKQAKTHGRINFEGHISEGLLTDLESGLVKGIELIDDKPGANFLENGLISKRRTHKVEVRTGMFPYRDKLDMLRKIFKIGKENRYRKARVVFKKTDGKDEAFTVKDLDNILLDNIKYAKKRIINEFDKE